MAQQKGALWLNNSEKPAVKQSSFVRGRQRKDQKNKNVSPTNICLFLFIYVCVFGSAESSLLFPGFLWCSLFSVGLLLVVASLVAEHRA